MAARPNLLIFHCHDLGQYLHCYGRETVSTPHLDAFAAQGVRFARSFCVAPQCSPSRAAIFTGRYPHANGVMGLCHAWFAWDLDEGEQHLAQLLKAAGYVTAAVGVIHETRGGAQRLEVDRHHGAGLATECVNQTIALLKEFASGDRPFYLQAGTIEPHRLRAPDEHGYMGFLGRHLQPDSAAGTDVPGYLVDNAGARTEVAELQGAVKHVDNEFGRLLQAIDDLGLADQTLVVFTTDHGVALPRAKCTLYDPGLETALILRLPSRDGWHGGRVVEPLVANVDYVPTWLELLGIAGPDNLQGESFAGLLDGRTEAHREAVFAELTYHEYCDPRRTVRTATHKLIANFSTAPSFMDCSQSWRPRADTVTPADPKTAYTVPLELYDLVADPLEQQNRADDPAYADIRRELLRRLRQHLQDTADPLLDGLGGITNPVCRETLRLVAEA